MTDHTKAAVEVMENARYAWLAGQRHPAQQYDPHADMKYALATFLALLDATGWQIVPKVATDEMCRAWKNSTIEDVALGGMAVDEVNNIIASCDYAAMLAAAPKWGEE